VASVISTIASAFESLIQTAMPSLPPVEISSARQGGASRTSMGARILVVVGRPITLIALAVTVMSLTSCEAAGSGPFLGPAYDGPTAAYGYNHP
jgi:hypothetical protein